MRAQLLNHRISEWQQMQKRNPATETEPAAQKRLREDISAMPKAELHRAAAEWRQEQEARQERAPRQRSGPSMSR
jgi:hypothetical protein